MTQRYATEVRESYHCRRPSDSKSSLFSAAEFLKLDACWLDACSLGSADCGIATHVLFDAIKASGKWFWSDPERHRVGRLDLQTARTEVVRLALRDLGIDNEDLAPKIGRACHDWREERLEIYPDALDTLQWLREQGCRLALLTNGNGMPQRRRLSLILFCVILGTDTELRAKSLILDVRIRCLSPEFRA
jgi:putative hydrolase of the HAD superfamily